MDVLRWMSPVKDDQAELKQYIYDSARDLDFNHILANQAEQRRI